MRARFLVLPAATWTALSLISAPSPLFVSPLLSSEQKLAAQIYFEEFDVLLPPTAFLVLPALFLYFLGLAGLVYVAFALLRCLIFGRAIPKAASYLLLFSGSSQLLLEICDAWATQIETGDWPRIQLWQNTLMDFSLLYMIVSASVLLSWAGLLLARSFGKDDVTDDSNVL